jgi:hypothetical protein
VLLFCLLGLFSRIIFARAVERWQTPGLRLALQTRPFSALKLLDGLGWRRRLFWRRAAALLDDEAAHGAAHYEWVVLAASLPRMP